MEGVIYKKYGIKIHHIWNFEKNNLDLLKSNADILYFHGVNPKFYSTRYEESYSQYTLITNLEEEENILKKKISKNYRYEINKCVKENIKTNIYTSENLLNNKFILEEFKKCYEDMYLKKEIRHKFNMDLIMKYIENDMLIITTVEDDNEKTVVFHAYITSKNNVRLLYSTSVFRNDNVDASKIGRFNKYLHWNDIKYFKYRNIKSLDWGGLSSFEDPNGIDLFKIRFGGAKLKYNNILISNSILGYVIILFMKIKGRL